MARAYSDDLRGKVLSAYAGGKGTMRELAQRFDVSHGWVLKIAAAQRRTGSDKRVPQRRAGSRVDAELIRQLVEAQPDIVLVELQQKAAEHGASSGSSVCGSKKVAIERDTEDNLRKREAHLGAIGGDIGSIPPEDLIYLDESGVSTQMTRLYGRAPKGRRIRDRVPAGHWKMLTILGAMDHTGMLATMTVESATDGDVFLAFRPCAVPEAAAGTRGRDGQPERAQGGRRTRTHRGLRGIRALFAALLARLEPYRKGLVQAQGRLRALAARALPQFEHAIAQALQTLTAKDAQAWLRLRFGYYT